MSPSWSLKAEYQYFDFGTATHTVFNAGLTPFDFEHELTAHTVKIGVNYLIGGGY